jgi:hypothetical protein
MAQGDYHVENKGGRWEVEQEGHSTSSRQLVETLGNREQSLNIAAHYARSEKVDVFLRDGRRVKQIESFREHKESRNRRG